MVSEISLNLHTGASSPASATCPAEGYKIIVGHGIGSLLGDAVLRVCSIGKQVAKVAVITHPRLERLYGNEVRDSLKKTGVVPFFFTFPEGETNKTLGQAEKIYDFLVQHKFERSSTLMALGGGVVGDMTGFVAATFLRGISYIQCPTTVVAQVDAAIGGKTGVDHAKGKNLIGAFHQPSFVFIDTKKLETLSRREYVAGLAEVVKYGVIYDEALFSFMETHTQAILNRDQKRVMYCVKRSAEIKAEVVMKDEKELSLRKILNYGHTFGHAVETLTGYRQYKHGEAVAIGMVVAANMAYRLGIGSLDVVNRQNALLKALGLPTQAKNVCPNDIMSVLESDKKVVGGEIYFVLPEKIGSVCVQKVERKTIAQMLKEICLN